MTLPIDGKLSRGSRQDGGSKTFDVNPGQNQESTVIDDVLQVAGALFRVPTDPLIACGHLPCRTRPLQGGQDAAVSGFDNVAQIGSERNAVAEIVITLDELAEEWTFGVVNQTKPERFQIGNPGLDWRLRILTALRVGTRGPRFPQGRNSGNDKKPSSRSCSSSRRHSWFFSRLLGLLQSSHSQTVRAISVTPSAA